jgi:mannose-6-phosphate isomerase-like protein (cupin superfamily)
MTVSPPVNLTKALASFTDNYSPRIVARVNDYDVRVAHASGDHVWHVHDETDEFFLVLEGQFTINLRGGAVVLGPGDIHVVPRGVEHFPQAEPGTRILMFEPTGTPNTGSGDASASHITTTSGVDLTG